MGKIPEIPVEYKRLMGRLDQNSWEIAGNAKAMAKVAVGRPSKETCVAVIDFIERLMKANPTVHVLHEVWFSSPVETTATANGNWEENDRMLREFFAEMRRLLAERLEFLERQT
ncbi:MAG: hypothetical protein ACRCYS_02875 [Beijerinckiaceae bacterium]